MSVTITITEQHLDKAITARERRAKGYEVARDCVFGQAAQEVFGDKLAGTHRAGLDLLDGRRYWCIDGVRDLVFAFDQSDHHAVRRMLPLTAVLSREVG